MNNTFLAILWLTFSTLANTQNSTCYFPDGSWAPDSPCNPTADVSFCCGANTVCLQNKICYHSDGPNTWGRGTCTDPTWQSPDCPQFCLSNRLHDGGTLVQCNPNGADPNSVCCFDTTNPNAQQCCNNPASKFTLQGSTSPVKAVSSDAAKASESVASSTTTAAESTKTTASSSSSTSSASASTSTSSSSSSSSSTSPTSTTSINNDPVTTSTSVLSNTTTPAETTGTTATSLTPVAASPTAATASAAPVASASDMPAGVYVGIAIGSVAGVALICGIAWVLFKRQRHKKRNPEKMVHHWAELDPAGRLYQEENAFKTVVPVELDAWRRRVELDSH